MAEEVAGLVEARGVGGLGEDEEEAVVGEGLVAEIGGEGGAEMEEFEGERGVLQGFQDFGGFERGEGEGERLEIVGEVGEGVGEGGGRWGEEDLGGFADEVTAGEEVASRVGGEGRRRSHLRREGTASGGGGGDPGGVLCGEAAAEMEEVWGFHLWLGLVGLMG